MGFLHMEGLPQLIPISGQLLKILMISSMEEQMLFRNLSRGNQLNWKPGEKGPTVIPENTLRPG